MVAPLKVTNKSLIFVGTVSAYLSPDRDLSSLPQFAIGSRSGLIEAKGTFYAVTEYNGQTYTAIKHGEIKKEPKVPVKSNFAYVKKSSSKKPLKPAKRIQIINCHEKFYDRTKKAYLWHFEKNVFR